MKIESSQSAICHLSSVIALKVRSKSLIQRRSLRYNLRS
jgi:hypothetical protein